MPPFIENFYPNFELTAASARRASLIAAIATAVKTTSSTMLYNTVTIQGLPHPMFRRFSDGRTGGRYRSVSSGFSTISQIMASVVSMREAMEAAFCRAVRVTLVGSITPAFTRSSYCSVEALKP